MNTATYSTCCLCRLYKCFTWVKKQKMAQNNYYSWVKWNYFLRGNIWWRNDSFVFSIYIQLLLFFYHTVPHVKSVVYSTCSIYPEENEKVVTGAVEEFKACSEGEGEPKPADFRSASVSVSHCPGFTFCHRHCFITVWVSQCLSSCGVVCLFFQKVSCLSLSSRQERSEKVSLLKDDQRFHFLSLNAVEGCLSFYWDIFYFWIFVLAALMFGWIEELEKSVEHWMHRDWL